MDYSTKIYNIYLNYIAPENIHVYSIGEVFIDVTSYLGTYRLTIRELARKMILNMLRATGITATAGVGANLYLCKIAVDIVAKRIGPDENGVRIAELDELFYRRILRTHRPLTNFWCVGKGYAKKLEEHGLYTMGGIARCSLGRQGDYYNEDLLYKLFGVSAELLIDHAWGWEPCAIADIKAYKSQESSMGFGQVLLRPCGLEKARLIVQEMTDLLALGLVDKGMATDQIVFTVGYDTENLTRPEIRSRCRGPIVTDRYGRRTPGHAHGSESLGCKTSPVRLIMEAAMRLYDRIADRDLLVHRVSVVAAHVEEESGIREQETFEQLDLFTDYEAMEKQREQERQNQEREKRMQKAMLDIKKRFGKNAILRGINLEEGATTMKRNKQIGSYKV